MDVISVELLLDTATEASVRGDWERLAAAGLSSLAPHRSASNRPHVTLLVRGALPALRFADAVAALPVPITLAEPVFFDHGDRGVLAWGVTPTPGLVELHRRVHAEAGEGDDAPHTRPGEWTPHVTLARRLRRGQLEVARDLLAPPREGTGVALRRWDSAARQVTDLGEG